VQVARKVHLLPVLRSGSAPSLSAYLRRAFRGGFLRHPQRPPERPVHHPQRERRGAQAAAGGHQLPRALEVDHPARAPEMPAAPGGRRRCPRVRGLGSPSAPTRPSGSPSLPSARPPASRTRGDPLDEQLVSAIATAATLSGRSMFAAPTGTSSCATALTSARRPSSARGGRGRIVPFSSPRPGVAARAPGRAARDRGSSRSPVVPPSQPLCAREDAGKDLARARKLAGITAGGHPVG